MKRSFQKGNRLWAIESVGKRVTTTWGVVGGKTQSKSAGHGTVKAATLRIWSDARLKLRAGYVETTFRGDLPLSDPTAQGLIEALAEDPDDIAAHMAFSDWLSEQADDRLTAWGEFIRLQLVEEPRRVGKLKSPDTKRIEELRDEYEIHWLGEGLAMSLLCMGSDYSDNLYSWLDGAKPRRYVRGWLDSFTVFCLDKTTVRAMGQATALRLTRSLTISSQRLIEHENGSLALLAKSSVLKNVRHLSYLSYRLDTGLYDFIQSFPRLKSLRLAVLGLAAGRVFAMPELASLDTLEVIGPDRYSIKKLTKNPAVANLRRLALNTTTDPDGRFDEFAGSLGDAELDAICQSRHLKGLKELAFHSSEITPNGCMALISSGILTRLELLDLTHGDLNDTAMEIFLMVPDFAKIPRVILDENYLSPEMVVRLRRFNKGVQAKDQRDILGEDEEEDDWLEEYDELDDFAEDEE
jgi:uncharacterized protein (TIGR02996 family)